jgi:hypothetical protein
MNAAQKRNPARIQAIPYLIQQSHIREQLGYIKETRWQQIKVVWMQTVGNIAKVNRALSFVRRIKATNHPGWISADNSVWWHVLNRCH